VEDVDFLPCREESSGKSSCFRYALREGKRVHSGGEGGRALGIVAKGPKRKLLLLTLPFR